MPCPWTDENNLYPSSPSKKIPVPQKLVWAVGRGGGEAERRGGWGRTSVRVGEPGALIDVETQKGEKEKGIDWVMFSVLFYRPADTVGLVRLEGDRDEGSPSTQST